MKPQDSDIGRLFTERLLPQCVRVGGCLICTRAPKKNGYVQLHIRPKRFYAHRLSYEAHYGPIPDEMYVLHRCDVRACCEPTHLFIGTQADNIADMDSKGRRRNWHPRGMRNPAAILTEAKVIAIRSASGMNKDIAVEFGVSKSLVSAIKRREVWQHI